jgi:hypothetical protein
MAKLTCQQAQQLFDAYLDGELSAALEMELDAHRLGCAGCRQALALMEVAGHMIAADRRTPNISEDFTQRLLACVAAPAPLPMWRRRRTLWMAGSGLATAAAIALAFTFSSAPPKKMVLGRVDWSNSANQPARDAQPSNVAPGGLKESFDGQWSQVRQSTEWLREYGKMTVMQILDRLGLEQARPGDKFDSTGGKAPGLRKPPSDDSKRDIEDL